MIWRISLIDDVTALKVIKCALVCMAMISARVVLPVPGGPHKIREGTRSFSINSRRILPGPIRSFCPTNSDKFCGLTRSASGVFSFSFVKEKSDSSFIIFTSDKL